MSAMNDALIAAGLPTTIPPKSQTWECLVIRTRDEYARRIGHKICSRCNRMLPLSAFHQWSEAYAVGGRQARCKTCRRIVRKQAA